MNVNSYVAEFAPPYDKSPAWGRTSYHNPETGAVFVPAVLGGNETAIFMCAVHDGVSLILEKGRVYVPAEWLAGEVPDIKSVIDKIVDRTRRAAAEEPE